MGILVGVLFFLPEALAIMAFAISRLVKGEAYQSMVLGTIHHAE